MAIHRISRTLRILVLGLSAAAVFGLAAALSSAPAAHYHVTCVGHGFVHGSDAFDGYWHARIDNGCSNEIRDCWAWWWSGSAWYIVASDSASGTSTCNAFAGGYQTENNDSVADLRFPGVFTRHDHCGHYTYVYQLGC